MSNPIDRHRRAPCLVGIACGLAFLLASCGGPEGPIVPRGQALGMREVMTVKVIAVYDRLEHNIPADPEVSDIVQVEVIEGPRPLIGTTLNLPYDRYVADNQRPPSPGTTLTIMACQWVKPAGIPR